MRARYRRKALIGVGCFFGLLLSFVVLIIFLRFNRDSAPSLTKGIITAFFVVNLLALLICFFWTGHSLAEAKGYPGAIVLFGLLGPPAQLAVLVALLVLPDRNSEKPMRRGTRISRSHHGSNAERIVIWRRNAVVGIVFGLVGIAAGIMLVLFRMGIFADHDNEMALGIFVFIAGYGGVITGCWYWVKAKNWVDAVVFIGLLPLAILCIPGIRLIFRASPMLLPASMVMMPIILIVVVLVLPDKSGWTNRKRWRIGE